MSINTGKSVAYSTAIAAFLCMVVFIAYWHITDNQFVSYDDDPYILDNPMLRLGLGLKSLIWAFTSLYAANWHPLTWLSHLLDVQLFGMNPAGHHLVNVALHAANAVILFGLLCRLTGSVERSAVVAALFALHPLHVESVAWAAERKDVLSTLFWMLSLYCYCNYARRPQLRSYILVIVMFVLGLMAKPMLVTLPFVMLMLDYWPLKRFSSSSPDINISSGHATQSLSTWYLIREKIPFLVLVIISCAVTVIAQQRGLAITSLSNTPLLLRFENATVVYVQYLAKMIWPHNLAVFYPFPESIPVWQTIGASCLLIATTAVLFRLRHRYPYLIVGWAWYIITLVPVIGIVRIGLQAMADRYTYVPLTGIFVMLVWGIADLAKSMALRRYLLAGLTAVVLTSCLMGTRQQLSYWLNAKTLFTHALLSTKNNFIAHCMLGRTLEKEGKLDEALAQFDKAIAIAPWYEYAQVHQGIILKNQGRLDAAVFKYNEAILQNPESEYGHLNLGIVMALQDRLEDARTNFDIALKLNPDSVIGHYNMGLTLSKLGRTDEAIIHFSAALDNNPLDADSHNNLGVALISKGRTDEAIQHFAEAIRIKPQFYDAISNRELALKIKRGIPRTP